MRTGKLIKAMGHVVLAVGLLIVFVGYAGIGMREGFWALHAYLNPLNISNLVAVGLLVAPGISLVWLGNWLIARRHRQDVARSKFQQ